MEADGKEKWALRIEQERCSVAITDHLMVFLNFMLKIYEMKRSSHEPLLLSPSRMKELKRRNGKSCVIVHRFLVVLRNHEN